MMHVDVRLASTVVCLVLITTSGCSGIHDESESDLAQSMSPILGGTAATQDQIFSTVALLNTKNGSILCTGTLIAPTVVVTSAHCVVHVDQATGQITSEYSPSEIIVAAGALDALSAPTEQRYDVTKIVPNISYTGFVSGSSAGLGQIDDIAILVLKQSITTLSPAQVLPLAQFDSKLSKGMDVTIEGYGFNNPEMTLNGQLYIANTPYQQRSDAELIAGAPGSPDTCFGDSGGPAYLAVEGAMYLLGVASRGVPPDPKQCGNGAIYTIVSSYETWLHDNTGGAYPPAPGGSSGSSGPPSLSGCTCKVGSMPASSGQGLWMGLGIALLVSRRHRRSRSSHAPVEPIDAARAPASVWA